METTLKTRLKKEALTGAKQGWYSFLWMAEIIVPISLIMAVL